MRKCQFHTFLFLVFLLLVFGRPDAVAATSSLNPPIWMIRSKTADPYYRFVRSGKAGYIDRSGKVIIEAGSLTGDASYGGEFHDGRLLVYTDELYVDATGQIAIEKKFCQARDFSEGLAAVMEECGGKWGYINSLGEWVVPPKFEISRGNFVSSFSDGLAKIQVQGQIGYIDRSGQFVIKPEFLEGESFQNGFARVVAEGPCRSPFAGIHGSTYVVRGGDEVSTLDLPDCQFTFIDKAGKLITAARFEDAKNFAEGLAPVQISGKWGFIDTAGNVVIEPQFASAEPFSEGLARVRERGLFGYIDQNGRFAIPPQFSYAGDFSEGLATVGEGKGYWYIDQSGKQAIAETFALASHFVGGLAHVKLTGGSPLMARPFAGPSEWGTFAYIDKIGKKVFVYSPADDPEYQRKEGDLSVRILYKSTEDLERRAIRRRYPPAGNDPLANGLEVPVWVYVNEFGEVEQAMAVPGVGTPRKLVNLAVLAAYGWRWPESADGGPTRMQGTIRIRFQSAAARWPLARVESLIDRDEFKNASEAERHALRARAYLDFGYYEEAAQAYEQLLQLTPKNLELYGSLAHCYYFLGEPEKAIAVLRTWTELAPKSVSAWEALARTYLGLERYQEAVDAFRQITFINLSYVNSAQIYANIGWALGKLGRDQEAVEAYRESIKRRPDDQYIYPNALTSFRKAGHEDEWLSMALQALQREPGLDDLRATIGYALMSATRYEEAVQVLKNGVDRGSRNFQLHQYLGFTYSRQGDSENAAAILKRALDLEPPATNLTAVIWRLAGSLVELNRAEEAVKYAEQAVSKLPKDPNAHWLQGWVLEKLDRRAEAEHAYREAVRLAPDNAMVINNVSYFLLEDENLEEGLKLALRASELDPKSPYIMDTLGWAYHKAAKIDDAERLLKAAASQLPDSAIVQEHLGDVLHAKGDEAEARQAWERSLSISKDSKLSTRVGKKLRALETKHQCHLARHPLSHTFLPRWSWWEKRQRSVPLSLG